MFIYKIKNSMKTEKEIQWLFENWVKISNRNFTEIDKNFILNFFRNFSIFERQSLKIKEK